MRQMFIEREILGRLTLVLGVALIIGGVLFIGGSQIDLLFLSLSWFSGTILLILGLAVGFEAFAHSTKIGKLGILLMAVSGLVFVTGLVLFNWKTFNVHITGATDVFVRGSRIPNFYIQESRPFTGVFVLLTQIALGLFLPGLALKLYDDLS